MYRIATNETITFLNLKAKRLNISSSELQSHLINNLESDVYFEGSEIQLKLQQAIATLPQKQQQVFTMKYFEELKYREMAEILETSEGALKASFHIASKNWRIFKEGLNHFGKSKSKKQMEKNKFTYNQRSGFRVPENYFEEFESRVFDSNCSEPGIGKGKNTGFGIPSDYFETLEDKIYARISATESKGKVIPFYKTRKFYYSAAVAASFVGLVSTLLFKPVPENSFDSLELSAIEEYLDSGNIDFNYNEISAIIYEEDYVLIVQQNPT